MKRLLVVALLLCTSGAFSQQDAKQLKESENSLLKKEAQFEKERIERLRQNFIHQHGLRSQALDDDFIPSDPNEEHIKAAASEPELMQWWDAKAGRANAKAQAAEPAVRKFTITINGRQVKIGDTPIEIGVREITEEPTPPSDRDGDGIPDDQDECPDDPANKCNEPEPPQPSANSPTGYEPKLGWSKEQQGRYNAIVAANGPDWQILKKRADLCVAGTPGYAGECQYPTLAYQYTGNLTYAKAGYKYFVSTLDNPSFLNANNVREVAMELTVCLEWLTPALTNEELMAGVARLDKLADFCLGVNQPIYTGGFRVGDSDQTIGQFFFLAAMDKAFGHLRPEGWVPYLQRSSVAKHLPVTPVGGLTPTGTGTIRDVIALYAKQAEGGEWIESSGYNFGTEGIFTLGVWAVGLEYFPEYVALFPQLVNANDAKYTPDYKSRFKWGDEEGDDESHSVIHHLFYQINDFHLWSGITESSVSDSARGTVKNLQTANVDSIYAIPWWRAFWTMNPGSTQHVDNRQVNSAIGLYVRKTDKDLFAVHFPAMTGVDHSQQFQRFGNFTRWYKGEWVWDSPIGYGTLATYPEAGNCVVLAGLGPMTERSHRVEGNKFIGETKGPYYLPPFWNPPATFLRMYRREATYEGNTLTLHDYIDMDDPQTLTPGIDRYYPAEQNRIKAAGKDLIQLVFHCPVQPTVEANAVLWKTKGGQQLKVSWPDSRTVKVFDESVVWASDTSFPANQKKWHFRLIPNNFTGGIADLTTKVEVIE